MIVNLERNKKLWMLISVLSLVAALVSVLNQSIYSKVVSLDVLPGTISQDIITVIIGLALLFLGMKIEENDIKKQIMAISFVAYLFYGYGIYVIEQLYTPLYLLYIAIFALSFWTIIFGLVNLKQEVLESVNLSKFARYLSIVFLIFIPLLFYSLWIGQLLPLIQNGEKLEFKFSIFILDMVFVLPTLIMSAVLIIKGKGLGFILAPILFFKAFTLLFSVGLGELLKALYSQTVDLAQSAFYIILSIIFLILGVLNFFKLRFEKTNKETR